MKRARVRPTWIWAGVSFALVACGGIQGGTQHDTADASMDAGSSSSDAGQAPDTGSTPEGGSSGDARTCVDIDPATYDTSCQIDSDCIDVSGGVICSGYNCLCGGTAISASEQARYNAALASVPAGPGPHCNCPYFGRARCVQSQCVICHPGYLNDPNPPGCPDGG
jgi:hypothetical protein